MVQTLVGLGTASLAGMVISKILEESGKFNWAQYINLTTSAFLGGTALVGLVDLFVALRRLG